jgi:hypothetical protein
MTASTTDIRSSEGGLHARLPEPHPHEHGQPQALGEPERLRPGHLEKRRATDRFIATSKLFHEPRRSGSSPPDARKERAEIIEIFDGPVRHEKHSIAGPHR